MSVLLSLFLIFETVFARAMFSQIIVNNLFGDTHQEIKKHSQKNLQIENIKSATNVPFSNVPATSHTKKQ